MDDRDRTAACDSLPQRVPHAAAADLAAEYQHDTHVPRAMNLAPDASPDLAASFRRDPIQSEHDFDCPDLATADESQPSLEFDEPRTTISTPRQGSAVIDCSPAAAAASCPKPSVDCDSQTTTTTDDESEGGVQLDIDMDSAGEIEMLYPVSALQPTTPMDEEDDFSPSNLVTRPPSPVGGGLSGILDLLASQNGGSIFTTDHDTSSPASAMHVDSSVGLTPPDVDLLHTSSSTPTISSLSHNHSQIPGTTTASQSPSHHHPSNQIPQAGAAEPVNTDEGIYVSEHGYVEEGSMSSQPSFEYPSATTAWTASPSSPVAAAAMESENWSVAEDDGGGDSAAASATNTTASTPATSNTPSSPAFSAPQTAFPPLSQIPVPPPAFSPAPVLPVTFFPTSYWNNNTSLILPPVVVSNTGFFPEDAEAIEGITNFVFEHELPCEDFELYNPDFATFFGNLWNRQYIYRGAPGHPRVSAEARNVSQWARSRPDEITDQDVAAGNDMQWIQWDSLGITRERAREIREKEYVNYRNIKTSDREDLAPLRDNTTFFKFRRLDTQQRCRLMHFQLRNVLGVTSRNDVFYGSETHVMRTNPTTASTRTLMDLSDGNSVPATGNPIRISTLGACGGRNGVVIAGGFRGEYALKAVNAPESSKLVTGVITDNENGITNHVELVRNRTTGTPNAVFSSNDAFIRILNCGEGLKFISSKEYAWAVNCSATSPDSRLRVVVGDSKEVLITDADRGNIEFELPGHTDYGFAAAWSEDGYTIATGNQDQTVRIFDARNFKRTVKVLPTRMAGCRALRFSPLGEGGPRVLAMAEPADFLHIVDAVSWEDAQTVGFWGEIGGIEFSPSGEELWVANVDRAVGGLMELKRAKGGHWSGESSWKRKRKGWWRREEVEIGDSDEESSWGCVV